MPVFGVRVHPRRLVASWKVEHGVGGGKAIGGARPKQEETITVEVPYSVGSNDSFACLVVLTYIRVEVAKKYELAHLWNSEDEGIQLFIELLLN